MLFADGSTGVASEMSTGATPKVKLAVQEDWRRQRNFFDHNPSVFTPKRLMIDSPIKGPSRKRFGGLYNWNLNTVACKC